MREFSAVVPPANKSFAWAIRVALFTGWLFAATRATAAEARAGDETVYHPGRILVQPRPGLAAQLEAFHSAATNRVLYRFPRIAGVQLVGLAPGVTVPAAVARYHASGWVEFAEPDYRVSAAATLPDDPQFTSGAQWGLHNYGQNAGLNDADVDAPEAWDVLRSASNIIVAVVDSGIRYTHEDLSANLWRHPVDGSHGVRIMRETSNGTPLVDTNVWDDYGHGTHVAGTLGAVGNNGKGVAGVAWRVQIMACKFLDSVGDGFYADAIACMEFARSNGAAVINLSWGGGLYSVALSNAIYAARGDGIVFTAASGNEGQNSDLAPFYPAGIALDNIVSVAAATRQEGRWASSNYGANSVDLYAPGVEIYSTMRTGDAAYGNMNGTSMAAPFVAGALALLRAQYPVASSQELIARLLAATDAKPAYAGRCVTGGRLNLRKALDLPRATVVEACAGCTPPQPARVELSGAPGHSYVLQASTNLTAWSALKTDIAGLDGKWTYTDPDSTNHVRRFYRGAPAP